MTKDLDSQIYRFVFTLTAPDGTLEDYMRSITNDFERFLSTFCKRYSFQLERGEQAGKLHYQGRFSSQKKMSIRVMLAHFTNTGITRGWNFHLDREYSIESTSVLYCSKPQTAIDGTFVSSFKSHSTNYRGEDLYLDMLPSNKYYWQSQLESHLLAPFWVCPTCRYKNRIDSDYCSDCEAAWNFISE